MRSPHQGFALLAALWLLVLMSVIANAMAWSNRQSIRGMAAMTGGVQARYLAEGAFQLVYANLLEVDPMRRLLGDGEVFQLAVPGGQVRVRVTDENGKVDINRATVPLLARLLYSLDVEPATADSLADAIADFRDEDDLHRLNGAEDPDYEAAGLEWGAKDAEFTSVGELRQVLGMEESLFEMLEPHVTVHSRQRGISPEVASLPVLMAASGESAFSLESYIEQRRRSNADGLPLPKAPTVDRRFLTGARGVTYSLTAVGLTMQGGTSGLSTTIRLRRSRSGAAIQTLEWLPYLHSGVDEDVLLDGFELPKGPG